MDSTATDEIRAMSQTILYARVSTADQTIAHQRKQAQAAGFTIDEVISDNGVSGVSTRLIERPQGRRLFDLLRKGDTLVVRWVDRLGRNYADVTDTIRDFMRRGVIIRTVISGLTFDGATSDPMQQAVRDALIAFMAASAQVQAEAAKAAQQAGIEHAKADRTKYPRPQAIVRPRAACDCLGSPRPRCRAGGGRQGDRDLAAGDLPHRGEPGGGRGNAGQLGDVSERDRNRDARM